MTEKLIKMAKKTAVKGSRLIKGQTLKPGYVIALVLKEGTAPLRCYVGEIQDVDEYGVRLTLVDWLIGQFCGWDFFTPWESINSALIATPSHDIERFGDGAAEFQLRCNHMAEGEEAVEKAIDELRRMRREARS